MDVDLPSSSSKRPADFPPASTSADKRTKNLLQNEQLTTLSSNMDSMKNQKNWQIWVDQAEVDNSRWLVLLSDVLVSFTELASTNMKDSVIANLNFARAQAIVKSFNEDELEGWKNGVKKSDWIDLHARLLKLNQLLDEPEAVEEALPGLTPSSSNNFTPAQHKVKDEEVTQAASRALHEHSELTTSECAILLRCIVKRSEGKLQDVFTDIDEALELVRKNPKLESALKKAWRTKDYQEIWESELLTVPRPYKNQPAAWKAATESAWNTRYRGKAPEALWARMKKAMTQEDRYARYLAIVQSSGTGKSRMIEELSKKRLVIPVNLRGSFETGYPPPDKIARDYISGTISEMQARVHAAAFLRAVFNETSKVITNLRAKGLDRHDKIVNSFSEYMSEDMSCESHGENRRSFYENVVSSASQLEKEIRDGFASKPFIDDQLASAGICNAFENLTSTLYSLRKNPVASATKRTEPLVILAFDEARALSRKDEWSPFSELRRALRVLNDQLLFSLFLTTTGNVNALVPSSSEDLSGRIRSKDLFTSHPFAEVGFDHFAIKNQFNLRKVTDDEHISHFGRPLWATRYDQGTGSVKSDMVQFAALKLRAGKTRLGALSQAEKLACLAQRLPIEFHSITYASKVDELELVEGHMRILLRLDAGFESLITVSASEPLLSEAAYTMMYFDNKFKAAKTLKSCLAGYAINKGDRGELLVMLLFILARDRAIGPPDPNGRPSSGRRWCLVPRFMKSLFRFEYPLAMHTLANSKIFFNHWVKVHQHAMVSVEYLAQLMRRGAAILCGTNQAGIDGIIPFLKKGYTIFLQNIGVILIQMKNDEKYQDTPILKLFKAMDPYALGILNPGDKIPIIRIVFALASKTPCFTPVECNESFETHDFWVGGISSTVFLPVRDRDESIWAALLQASYGWEGIYKTDADTAATRGLRRMMNPGAAKNKYHWENWANFTAHMDED